MKCKIALIGGDGIGPEVVASAVEVLEKIGGIYGHAFEYAEAPAGGTAIDKTGVPLPEKTVEICRQSDAVLFGAVGGSKWDILPGNLRPEKAILGLREKLGLYANLRPSLLYPALAGASPLRSDITAKGIDFVFVRELTGGIYFGERGRKTENGKASAFDTEVYSVPEIERIGRKAFELARNRRKSVASVDKANVLETSRLWRETMHSLSGEYPDISYRDILVDNTAMQLVSNPAQFDVIVTSNLFGDILSDEAAAITGSIGLSASASIGDGTIGLYEPIHGSAPDIAGQGKANPIAAILSAAMMLKYSFKLFSEAEHIEKAVGAALDGGARTADLAGAHKETAISTRQMTDTILMHIMNI